MSLTPRSGRRRHSRFSGTGRVNNSAEPLGTMDGVPLTKLPTGAYCIGPLSRSASKLKKGRQRVPRVGPIEAAVVGREASAQHQHFQNIGTRATPHLRVTSTCHFVIPHSQCALGPATPQRPSEIARRITVTTVRHLLARGGCKLRISNCKMQNERRVMSRGSTKRETWART
jgi:hypothetical protein